MKKGWWKINGNRIKKELGEKVDKIVLTGEVPDGIDLELNTEEIPTIDLKLETKTVKCEVRKFKVAPYDPPTDKEIIEGLEFCDNYEAAGLITYLKKQNRVLKGKLTKMTKKANAYKEDLDNANIAVKQLIKEKYDEV